MANGIGPVPRSAPPVEGDPRYIARDWDRWFESVKALLGRIHVGEGTPEGAITAPVGSIYLRTDGGAATTLYVKETGAAETGWVGK